MKYRYWVRPPMGLSHIWHRAEKLEPPGVVALYSTACGMMLGHDDATVSTDLSGSFLTCKKCDRRVILEAANEILHSEP